MVPAALFPALAVIGGVAAGIALDIPAAPCLWLLPMLAVAAAALWRAGRVRISAAVLVAAFALAGALLGSHARDEALNTELRAAVGDARQPLQTRLLLAEDAAPGEDVTTLRGRVLSIRAPGGWMPAEGGVIVSVGGAATAARSTEWRRGRVLEAPIAYRRPARYLDAGVPDFEREAALDGVSLLGSIKSALVVDVVQRGTFADERGADVRDVVRHAVATHVGRYSDLSAAIVTAVLIGDRTGLPDEVRTRLQAAGTYHVIAISGGNIAIFTTVILIGLIPIGVSGRLAAVATIALLLAYANVVTAGPSVWRATLVAVVYLLARVIDHRTPPWQAMAVAGGLIAIVEPLDVRNAGFVLTFGATAALLRAIRGGSVGPRRIAWLTTSVVSSAAVEIALLPVMAATFSRVTTAGLVLNLVAVPAMGVVQIAGLLAVVFDRVRPLSDLAGWAAHLGAAAIVESARLVEVAPWLAVRVPPPSASVIAAYYAGLTLVAFTRNAVPRIAGAAIVIAAGTVIVAGPRFGQDVSALRLTMFDVGQGDGMVLQVPGGHALMIDTGGAPFGGGSFDIGTRVVEPALWASGIASLESLLLTHGDPDHIGGATPLLDDFRPHALWEGIPVERAMSLQSVLAHAAELGIRIEQRREGEEFRLGDARVLVLHPPPPDWERRRVRNDDSVVLEVIYGDVALLLTGDIGADVERGLIPRLVPAKTRILKVAHHGSRTSTSPELLAAWQPQIALISCGRNNPFGHPAPDVIDRLHASGARIYRTDIDGEITVNTDGRAVTVTTFNGEAS